MNLRTYLMIKRAADEAKAEAPKAEAPKAEAPKAEAPKITMLGRLNDRIALANADALAGAKLHPYYTSLGAAGGALLGGGLGYGTAELAGLSGDDLSTAGRLGRYALIGGGALTGGLAGAYGTGYAFGGGKARHAGDGTRAQRRQRAIAAADPDVVAQDYIPG